MPVILRLALTVLFLFSAALHATRSTFHAPLSTLHAQGLPLVRNFTAEEYGGHNRNYDIATTTDGTVFVANFEGLLYYDRASWHILHTPDLSRVRVVQRDAKNNIWVGGYRFFGQVDRKPNGELQLKPIANKGLFKGEVTSIFEEGGRLMFATSDNAIFEVKNGQAKLNRRTNANTAAEDDTQTEVISGALKAVVGQGMGVAIADQQGRELYRLTEENGLCSSQVAAVAYDGHGLLWGATMHGIFVVEVPSAYSYILPKDGLAGEVNTIVAYGGKLFVGTTGGLYVISNRQCRRINEIDNICWKLCEGKGALLAATSNGIYSIAPNGSVNRLTRNATTALMTDGEDFYAGEPDGVYRYAHGGAPQKVSDMKFAMDIRKNADGTRWMRNVHGETEGHEPPSSKSATSLLPARLLAPLAGTDMKTQYAHGKLVWIGSDEKLTCINTADDWQPTQKARVCFRSIILGGDSVLYGGYGNMPKKLNQLAPQERDLRFVFAADRTTLTGKILYRYRLNSNHWSTWSEKQERDFLNLPYGNYTIYIQARMPDGTLTEEASIGFSIAYPLLMRWYMVVLYFAAIALLVYALLRYRLKRLERDKLKLERIVEERTADLKQAQKELVRQEKMASVGKLTEGLIDRILNPMNYIINFSKMSTDLLHDLRENIDNNKEQMDKDDYADTADIMDMLTENLHNVDQYGQNTTRTLKAMEEMLKDRTGGYVDMDLLPVLQQNEKMLATYYAEQIAQHDIQTTFNLPGTPMPIHGNPDMLSKTVMSLMGNAVYAVVKKCLKASNAATATTGTGATGETYKPQITLTASSTAGGTAGGGYTLKIRDNGIGIEETIINKIFDPFFTTKTTDEAAGVGLYLSREIIQNHGGDITVGSVKDQFTEFTITLPQKQTSL